MDAPPVPDASPRRPSLVETVGSLVTQRVAGLPAWVVVTQLFIGLGWLRAAVEKVIDPAWWRGEVIESFVAAHEGQTLLWYEPFLDLLVSPYAIVVAVVVVVAQLAAGASLVTGRFVGAGLAVGMVLNLHFLAAGAVNPSAFYLLSQGALALWLVDQGPADAWTRRRLHMVASAGAAAAVVSLPLISTIEPHALIDDPAAMFVLGGLLAIVGCVLTLRQIRDRRWAHAGQGRRVGAR